MKGKGCLDNDEKRIVETCFSKCNIYNATQKDVILVYPNGGLSKDVGEICERLQDAYELLYKITPVKCAPYKKFQKRITIGFRDAKDEDNGKNPEAGWDENDNRINIPYSYLTKVKQPIPIQLKDNLEFSCSHELVHPFEHIFLDGNENKKWKDGFCDFLRVFVLVKMDFTKYAGKWETFIKDKAYNKKDEYHDAAGRIFQHCESQVSDFRTNHNKLRQFIKGLINQTMNKLLDPKGEIQFSN